MFSICNTWAHISPNEFKVFAQENCFPTEDEIKNAKIERQEVL